MEGTTVPIAAIRSVGPDTIAIDLESPPGFDARPGHFVQLRLPGSDPELVRHYSISSATVDETFELTVTIDPTGDLTPRLASMTAGDHVQIAGPFGRTGYADEAVVVSIGGGPGIGPAIGVAERATIDGGTAGILSVGDRPIHVARLARLSRAGVPAMVVRDRIDPAVPLLLSDVDDRPVTAYVYGFSDFLDRVVPILEDRPAVVGAVKTENFG